MSWGRVRVSYDQLPTLPHGLGTLFAILIHAQNNVLIAGKTKIFVKFYIFDVPPGKKF